MIQEIYRRPLPALVLALMAGIRLGWELPRWLGWDLSWLMGWLGVSIADCGQAVQGVLAADGGSSGQGAEWPWALIMAAAAMAAAMTWIAAGRAARSGSPSRYAPPLLFFLCGLLLIAPWADPVAPADNPAAFAGDKWWRITGVVVEPIQDPGGRRRFDLAAETLTSKGASHSVSGRLRVTLYDPEASLGAGDRIAFTGRIRRPRNFHNPGGFDYERFLSFQSILATTYVRSGSLKVLARGSGKGAIDEWRRAIGDLFSSAAPAPAAGLLRALIVGDRDGMAPETREAFQRVGAGHLLAISGLHVGIVAGAAFFLFRWLLCRWTWLLMAGGLTRAAGVLALFPVIAYGLLAGMSPSTQRAVAMTAIFLAALLWNREPDPITILSAAAMGILVIHPPALFSISFQMSFAAVAAILLGRLRAGRAAHWRGRCGLFLWVSLLAYFGTLPLILYYFNRISLIGPLANLVLVPLVGTALAPAGLLAACLFFLWPAAAAFAAAVAGMIASGMLALVDLLAAIPMAAVDAPAPTLLEISLYYMLFCLALSAVARRGSIKAAEGGELRAGRGGTAPAIRRWLTGARPLGAESGPSAHLYIWRWLTGAPALGGPRMVWPLALLLLLLAGDAAYWVHRRWAPGDLSVTLFDVGQGTAALVRLPDGAAVMIDGGGFSDNSTFDVGERILAPYMRREKIGRFAALALTHPNADHLNGLCYLAERFGVDALWTNGEPAETEGYERLMGIIGRRDIPMPDFRRMDRRWQRAGVQFEILHPMADFMEDPAPPGRRSNENNNSMVIRITHGAISFLFTGDIMAPAEAALVEREGDRLASTVLVAPHHGSKTSSTEAFVAAVNPRVVAVSAGWKNHFGFPHPEVMARYSGRGRRLYRTDLDGAITFRSDGRRLRIDTAMLPPDPRGMNLPARQKASS